MKRINLRIEEVLYEQILAECNSRNKTFNEFMNDTLKELILSNTYNDLEERVDIKINRIVETLDRLVDLNVSISNSTHIQNELINEVLNIERIEFDNQEVLEESKIAQIERDLKATNRHSRILIQQMTTLLKSQDAVPTDLYKESYFYKKAVEIIDDDFKNQKMNHKTSEQPKENKKSVDDMFKNIYG